MKYSEENLRGYVKKCFKDAFKAEHREYSTWWNFEWVMVKNPSNVFQLYPIIRCSFDRVVTRVKYRLQNNLMKNFGIHYGDTDKMRCIFYENGYIDTNFTQFMFKTKYGNMPMSILDEESDNMPEGECMPAYRFEKLLFNYWGLDKNSYTELSKEDEKQHLPNSYYTDWNAFKNLYKDTFGVSIGKNYKVICSSGIEQL